MQVVINNRFLLSLKKNLGADPSCRLREKSTFNFENWRHRAEG